MIRDYIVNLIVFTVLAVGVGLFGSFLQIVDNPQPVEQPAPTPGCRCGADCPCADDEELRRRK